MTLSLENDWIWDSWYAHDGERWHCYFLKAPKSIGDPELRHWNVTQGHAVSDDLVTWEHLGTCLAPAGEPAWDDYTTWTGSVVQDEGGLWHLFYTGTSRSEDGHYQRIGHATSRDMHAWERVGDGLCLDLEGENADQYQTEYDRRIWHDRAMRDPWVMRDPEGDGWIMYFTARVPHVDEPNTGGAIGFATSPDLHSWTLQPPVFRGGYGQLEVPQVFSHEGRWYCLFCTAAEHFSRAQVDATPGGAVTGNHYLVAPGPRGPWSIAPGPFLDGASPCRRYAARILQAGGNMVILGFMDQEPDGGFGGYVMDPEPVVAGDDGLLAIVPSQRAAE